MLNEMQIAELISNETFVADFNRFSDVEANKKDLIDVLTVLQRLMPSAINVITTVMEELNRYKKLVASYDHLLEDNYSVTWHSWDKIRKEIDNG